MIELYHITRILSRVGTLLETLVPRVDERAVFLTREPVPEEA
jgi:hypothetical protein